MSRTAISLFAGVGGFDIALRNNGYKVIASVEIDKQCNKVLEQHFPDTKRYTDIKEVKGKDLINDGFKATKGIITGGFPCQDLSVAGKRAGLTGSRSGLYWEAHRLLDETKSETFILENVPGLLSSNGGKDFGIVLGSLVELGYSVGWRVLDAQHFGVPQRRRRVFIVGSRLGEEGIIKVLFERSSVSRNITQSKQEGQDSTTSTTESFGKSEFKSISNTIPASLYHKGSLNNQDVDSNHLIVEKTFVKKRRAQSNTDYETWKEGEVTPTLNSFDTSDVRTTTIVFKPHQEDGARIQNEVVNTLTAQMGTGGNNVPMLSTTKVRRLTPKECERLQGFPDDWTISMADSNRYKQMGNAVAVPVVDWLVKGFNE
jgi:DNA (cytosine-5)-methyltransferase 1